MAEGHASRSTVVFRSGAQLTHPIKGHITAIKCTAQTHGSAEQHSTASKEPSGSSTVSASPGSSSMLAPAPADRSGSDLMRVRCCSSIVATRSTVQHGAPAPDLSTGMPGGRERGRGLVSRNTVLYRRGRPGR